MSTPEWMLRPESSFGPCSCCGVRSHGDLIEKTLVGGSRVLRSTLFSAEVAQADGFLQRTDPRAKAGATIALLIGAASVHHVSVLIGLYAAILVLGVTSNVPWRFLVKRVWCFVPLFTGVVVLPATLSFVTAGHTVVPLGTWFGTPVGITSQGLTTAALIVMRVAVSVSLVVLLTVTTPWPRLLSAMRALRVPRAFVVVLGLAYRYLFDLLNTVTEMYEARKARAPRNRDTARGRAFVAATAGATFAKAHALSDEVYLAMVARGYSGQVPATDRHRLERGARAALAVAVAVLFLSIGVDHVVRY